MLHSVRNAVVVALVIAGSAQAQVAPLGFSAGIQVQSGTAGAAIMPGIDLTTGAHLISTGGAGTAQFHMVPAWNTSSMQLLWDFSCAAYGQGATSSTGAIRHEIHSTRAVAGRFVITWAPTISGTGAATIAVDLGDDSVVDAAGSAVIPFTLAAGMTSLRVHVSATASAGRVHTGWNSYWSYQGAAAGLLTVRFEPTHAVAVPLGAPCGGASLSAVGNFFGAVDLAAQCGVADDLAMIVLGFDQTATVLPLSPGCLLLTTPMATLWQNVPASGAVRWSLAFPVGSGPLSFAAQVVALDVGAWAATTSGGVWVSCQ